MLPVFGMQKTLASVEECGRPSVRSPAGEPVSVIACVVA